MAKRLRDLLAQNSMVLLMHVTLVGCVSTEALYAPYDAVDCNVVLEQNERGQLSLRDLISNTHFPWEPAVYFEFNSHVLDADNTALLAGAVTVLEQYPTLNLSLQGFADRIGSLAYNQALATRRVQSVMSHLVDQGISGNRVVSQPLGEGLSQFGSDEALSRSINRRVELMLLDEAGRPLHPLYNFDEL